MKALQLLKRGKLYWKKQAVILAFFMVSTGAGATVPFLIREFIDSITGGDLLLDTAVLIFLMGSLSSVAGFLGNYLFQVLAMEGVKNLQIEIYTNVQKAPVPYILEEKLGDIMSKITSDTGIVGQIISAGVSMLFLNVIRFSVVVAVLVMLDVRLSLVTFLSVPAYFVVFKTYNKRLRASTQKERQAFGRVVESLREKLQGLITIKLFNAQPVYQKKFAGDAEFWFTSIKQRMLNNTLSTNLIGYITSIMPLLILLFGGYRVIAGVMSIGTLIGFWQYMGGLYEPIRNVAEWNNGLQQSVSTSDRLADVLDMKEEVLGDNSLPEGVSLRLANVSFAYKEEVALKDVTVDIDYGTTVALVGRSGSGKSTFIKLLMAFYAPDTGDIFINKEKIQEYSLSGLRDAISYVQQKDFIFNTSITENITLGRSIPPEKVREYSECCLVDEFVKELPQQYNTRIGEGGFDLSDGQRQRIALARAVAREPRILILDEATSAIDSENEACILKNVREKMKGTIFVVSHRLSTIRSADKILVIDDGRIVGEGSHAQLEKENETYRQLFKEQLIR